MAQGRAGDLGSSWPVDGVAGAHQVRDRALAAARPGARHKAKAIYTDHGVDAETVIEVGDPKETICQAADKLNVDLLILGSHNRGPIQRFTQVQSFIVCFMFHVSISSSTAQSLGSPEEEHQLHGQSSSNS
ncbi:hypothetical protein ZWY2020_035870 [Hordeum vulgare]|nr:hypothetical protein ZWY2020_035870 [Hordeum vulgare]